MERPCTALATLDIVRLSADLECLHIQSQTSPEIESFYTSFISQGDHARIDADVVKVKGGIAIVLFSAYSGKTTALCLVNGLQVPEESFKVNWKKIELSFFNSLAIYEFSVKWKNYQVA